MQQRNIHTAEPCPGKNVLHTRMHEFVHGERKKDLDMIAFN